MAYPIYFTHFTRKREEEGGNLGKVENREREKIGEGGKEKEGKRKEGIGEVEKKEEEGKEKTGEVELLATPDLKSLSDAIVRIQQKNPKALKLGFNFST